MNLFIEIIGNRPVGHPSFEDNLIKAFGKIPPQWKPFIRVERPTPANAYEVVSDYSEYCKIDDVWTEVWKVREMTQKEKDNIVMWIIDRINIDKKRRVEYIREQIANVTDATELAIWRRCLEDTLSWSLGSIDPLNNEVLFSPPFPEIPQHDSFLQS